MKLILSVAAVLVMMTRTVSAQAPPAPIPVPAPGTYLVWDQRGPSLGTVQKYNYKYFEDADVTNVSAPGTLLVPVFCTGTPVVMPATGASPNGAMVPPAVSLTDSSGGKWTLTATGKMLRNGVDTGGGGSLIVWQGGKIYATGTDDLLYLFGGNFSWSLAPDVAVSFRCSAAFPRATAGVPHTVALVTTSSGGASEKSTPYAYTINVVAIPTAPAKLRTLQRAAVPPTK